MAIYHTLKLFVKHPLTKQNPVKYFLKFIFWQIFSKIFDAAIIYKFTDRAKLIIKKGMTGATGNLYFGLHEFEDMAFLLHFLRKEDLFVDAGANVGSYTVLASAHVGCKSISVEPILSTFQNLFANIAINQMSDKVIALNIGLGKEGGTMLFTQSLDTVIPT
ncbi:MAG: hypothetical protein EAZ53_09020 [Bacteroidetes bacterium]|nr:MAG: hypothetical protein EAZ53_09020 [Bacteroidota bacterium]